MKHKPFNGYSPKAYPEGSVSQYFGENINLYKNTCSGGNCLYGGHNGIDMVAPHGTPILAVDSGVVVEVKDSPTGYGKHVRIISGDEEIKDEWTYGHLSRIDVQLGWYVIAGEQIGLMGNTGFVVSGATPFWKYNPYAGTHLHLGKRYFKANTGTSNIQYSNGTKGTILNPDNGFMGSVPYELIEGKTESQEMKHIFLTFLSIYNKFLKR